MRKNITIFDILYFNNVVQDSIQNLNKHLGALSLAQYLQKVCITRLRVRRAGA